MTQTTDQIAPPNAGAAPRAEGTAGQSELDRLLSEYEKAPDQKPDTAKVVKSLEPVIQFAQAEMTGRARKVVEDDIQKALDFVYEAEGAKGVPKRIVRGYMEAYAGENPDFVQAFMGREQNRKTWENALSGAREAFLKDFKEIPGNTVRTDVEAARAAVTGAVQPSEPAKVSPGELMSMSDVDYRKLVMREIAKNER